MVVVAFGWGKTALVSVQDIAQRAARCLMTVAPSARRGSLGLNGAGACCPEVQVAAVPIAKADVGGGLVLVFRSHPLHHLSSTVAPPCDFDWGRIALVLGNAAFDQTAYRIQADLWE